MRKKNLNWGTLNEDSTACISMFTAYTSHVCDTPWIAYPQCI